MLSMTAPPLGTIDHWSWTCQTLSVRIKVLAGEKHLADTQKLSQSHPCGSQDATILQTSFLSGENNANFLSFGPEMLMRRLARMAILHCI